MELVKLITFVLIVSTLGRCGFTAHCTFNKGLFSGAQYKPKHLKFQGNRLAYYANTTSTFQLQLLIAGDVNPNPGPIIYDSTLEKQSHASTALPPNNPRQYSRYELLQFKVTNLQRTELGC